MNLTTLLQMAADANPDRIAFGSRAGDGVTYAELRDRALRGAALLREAGADRLVYVAENDIAFPTAIFAGAYAGVPVVPLNYRLGDEQLQDLLDEQGADALVVTDASSRPRVAAVVDTPLGHDEWIARTATGEVPGDVVPGQDPEDIAIVLYTSGTTSRPKAAVLRHRHITSYVLGSVEFASAGEDAAALVSVPPYHIAGVSNVVSNVYAGRRVVQLQHFDPAAWLDVARREQVSHALVVPTMLARIVELLGPDATEAGVPSLRTLAYGGARMPRRVIRRALELFPATDFVNAYGLTETASTIAVLGPDDHRLAMYVDDPVIAGRLSSAGRLLPGVEVQVRAADGTVLPSGEVGDVHVRGPQVSGEYLGAGSVLDGDGWFATRDRGWVDAEGYLYIEGRSDDTIIRGGENIAPAEVEDVLMAHPDVLEAAVVGVPDEEWGQRIGAVVVLRDGRELASDELRAFCREHLRSSKTPDVIRVWPELPRTSTGKLLRREVVTALDG